MRLAIVALLLLSACGPGILAPGASSGLESYEDLILLHSPMAYWRLDETAGVVAADKGSSQTPADFTGAGTVGAEGGILSDPNDRAFYTNATGIMSLSAGNVPSEFTVSPGGPLAIEVWVRLANTCSGSESLVAFANGNALVELGCMAGGFATFTVTDDSGASHAVDSTSASVSIDDSNWHHLVGVKEGGLLSLYVDGTLRASSVGGSYAAGFGIGVGSFDAGRATTYYNEIAFYHHILTDDEIARHRLAAGYGN
ncbi:MAG: LamG domain-containing protein [Bdellovibrionales bacterium]|nr:LamG domain-containing protein [Bdellovibrionales bacterium]